MRTDHGPRPTPRRRLHLRAYAALLLIVGLAGCAGKAPKPALVPPVDRPRLAVLPFDNLTDQGDAGETVTLVFFSEVGAQARYQPVESGTVNVVLDSLVIRTTSNLTAAQLALLGQRLGAERLLIGTVLESSVVRTPDGDLPSVGVTIKLLEAASGRVLWARMGFKSGQDTETVFGWGREKSRYKLAASLAAELLRDLPEPETAPLTPADTTHASGGTQ
jgi:TolB-like protein